MDEREKRKRRFLYYAITRGGGSRATTLYTTFSPNYKRPSATLSNGNLTLSATTTGYNSACSIDAKTSGRWYFEATVGAGFNSGTMEIAVGVVDYNQPLTTFAGQVGATGGQVSSVNVSVGGNVTALPFATPAAGDVICVDYDQDGNTIRFRLNGGAWSSTYPLTDTQPMMPWAYVSGNTCSLTLNFGASAFAYTPPTGATGWTTNTAYAGRYWRFYTRANIYNGAPNDNINCCEMELRLTLGGADETGSGTATSLNDAGAGFTPDKAFDNNTSTQCASANNLGTNWWLQYDFGVGVTKAIKQMAYRIRNDLPFINYPSRFHVMYSDDGTTFYPAGHYEPTYTSQGESQNFSLTNG